MENELLLMQSFSNELSTLEWQFPGSYLGKHWPGVMGYPTVRVSVENKE